MLPSRCHQRPRLGPSLRRALGIVALLLCWPALRCADAATAKQQTEAQLINWYYAATFGTGYYTAGDRSVAVLQIPFSRTVREARDDDWGARIDIPVTFGFYDYQIDTALNGEFPSRVSTASIMPGGEWNLPVARWWHVKPFVHVGAGVEVDGGDSALIYDSGVKSHMIFPVRGVELGLGATVTVAGYNDAVLGPQSLVKLVLGVDLVFPMAFRMLDALPDLGLHVFYNEYFNRLEFPLADDPANRIARQAELAVSVGGRHPLPFKSLFIEQVGLAVAVGGGVTGARLFFSLPY